MPNSSIPIRRNGTFVTPVGDFLQGRVAMVKDFVRGQQSVNAKQQRRSPIIGSLHQTRCRGRRRTPYRAQCQWSRWDDHSRDTDQFFFVAVRHGDQWLIEDGRAHFAPAPPST